MCLCVCVCACWGGARDVDGVAAPWIPQGGIRGVREIREIRGIRGIRGARGILGIRGKPQASPGPSPALAPAQPWPSLGPRVAPA